ncbi:MAG: mechanosensitive ion channel family protein [Kangiellaceae bacterium]|nr:mechanosensitive ion channel family protein [Kangiellaceae bacterium]
MDLSQFFADFKWGNIIWPAVTLIAGYVVYNLLQKYFNYRQKTHPDASFKHQIINFIYPLALIIVFILVLPIKDSLQGQIISLIGILLSASIALSSTTFLGNLMAGLWLRTVRNFRVGDFVEVDNIFGRVSGRGLLHIEIQNRERDLITLPNMFLVSHPVTVMHNDGTIVHTEISLGYDIDHSIIEPLLIKAAEKAGLENPFVYIESLGDFSIVYKIHGLSKDINTIISTKSKLNSCVLDAMHQAKIEIVSPSFMNQRQVNEQVFIPKQRAKKDDATIAPEDFIFDKAEKAEKLDDMRKQHRDLVEQIAELKAQIKVETDNDKKEQMNIRYGKLQEREDRMSKYIKSKEQEINQEGKDKV